MLKKEEWKNIEYYEGFYQVSNMGRIKSLTGWNGHEYIKRERILKPSIQKMDYGYCRYKVTLKKNKTRKYFKVHLLVAKAFIENPNKYKIVNHIDGNPLNNKIDNLEWCTQKYNVNHAIQNGLINLYIPTKEELYNLYVIQRISLKKISRQNHINIRTLKRYIKKYDIEQRSLNEEKTKFFITKEMLKNELQYKNQKEIAKQIGCNPSLISYYKRKFSI